MKDKRLEEILNEVSGVFDFAYECAIDEEERDYLNSVEERFFGYLKEKGLIEEE